MKNKEILYIIGVIILVIIIVVGISNLNKQTKITCNSPYVKVGTSCCLDQNSNNVCDNDEQVEEETNTWKLNSMNVYGGGEGEFMKCFYEEGYYSGGQGGSPVRNYDHINNIYSKDITVYSGGTYSYMGKGYSGVGIIAVYTDYDPEIYGYEPEGVTCQIEEYYDGVFNEVNTNSFNLYSDLPENKYGYVAYYQYENNRNISEAKYIISCKGDKSENEIKRTFRFHLKYGDEAPKISC